MVMANIQRVKVVVKIPVVVEVCDGEWGNVQSTHEEILEASGVVEISGKVSGEERVRLATKAMLSKVASNLQLYMKQPGML